MPPSRIRGPRSRFRLNTNFSTEDGGEAYGTGGFGETDHAVEAIVIGERQCFQAEAGCFLCKFLGMGCAIEKTEIGMAVQLGVWRPSDST
jgi:hypothetical protein